MSASLLFTTTVVPGRERDAYALLQEMRPYLEGIGDASVGMYRTIYGGAQSGTILVLMSFLDSASRAAAMVAMAQDAANNPSMKALNGSSAPITRWNGAMLATLDPADPPAPQVGLRWVLVFQHTPGRRAEVEDALADARRRHEALGARPYASRMEVSGATSGLYTYVLPFNNIAEREEFLQRNAASIAANGQPRIIQAQDNGAMSMTSSRFDIAYA